MLGLQPSIYKTRMWRLMWCGYSEQRVTRSYLNLGMMALQRDLEAARTQTVQSAREVDNLRKKLAERESQVRGWLLVDSR